VASTRVDLPLIICGENKHAKTSVCLIDGSQDEILLVVQVEVDKGLEHVNAQAQLVAKAVAAFNENNVQRELAGRPPLKEKVMPGIIMSGTSPAFFKIPVTETLSNHIRDGTYPSEDTKVTYCYPLPFPGCLHSEGMKSLDNRSRILSCFEAFKAIVGI